MATRGRHFEVRAENGEHLQCAVREKVKSAAEIATPVAVGDDVTLLRTDPGRGIIEKVHDRRTSFHRPTVDVDGRVQVLAANLDELAIVASIKSPSLKTGLIDRFLIAAKVGSLAPLLILNKIDLKKPDNLSEIIEAYGSIGCDVIQASASTGEGIDELRQRLKGHRTIFAGHSGVGKSSLLNLLIPNLKLKTREVSDFSDRGKHTTTHIELFELPGGGFVADLPGLKVMGLWNVDTDSLAWYYPEFEKYNSLCRFQPCSHSHEPNCAVKSAVEEGKIYRFRYENYLAIADSL